MDPAGKLLHEVDNDLQALRIDRTKLANQRKRSPLRVLISRVVMVVAAVALFLPFRKPLGGSLGISTTKVQVATESRRGPSGAQPILTAGGYVIAREQVEVGSKVTGCVVSLEVREGYEVTKGQVVAGLFTFRNRFARRFEVREANVHFVRLEENASPPEDCAAGHPA